MTSETLNVIMSVVVFLGISAMLTSWIWIYWFDEWLEKRKYKKALNKELESLLK